MKFLPPLLEKRPLALTLFFAALVVLILAPQVVSSSVTPYTDGNHYVQRAFALYGFLHTGQWREVCQLFTLPRQTICPPQYLLFFLLPRAWAGVAAYGAIQLLVNFGALAVAVWNLCRVFARPAWAPALFLFCACENYSFDYPYFFFLDLTFAAFGALALSFQVESWQQPAPRSACLAGATLGLLFWIKPANALIFTGIFALGEIAWAVLVLRAKPPERPGSRHLLHLASGFLPVLLAAILCGAVQTIFSLIEANELNREWETHLAGSFLRLFYFPLCFAYFYHAVAGLIIAAGLLALAHFSPRPSSSLPSFPLRAFLILALTYALFGEFFSCWVLVKTMRALVFMLPVLGLVLFHLAERCRIRAPALLAATLVYSAVLVTQLETDYFHSAPISPDKYLLADRWYSYLPMAWARYGSGHGVVLGLCDLIHREMPRGGRIGVTTERVFLDGRSISLDLNGDALLDGRPFLYHCFRLFDPEGRYSAQAFLSSDALILYVARNAQYSAFTWREDTGLLAYVPGHWAAPEDIRQILNPAGHLLGYYVPLAHRLSPAELAAGMKACNAPGPRPQDRIDDYLTGTHFSVRQCFALLREWALKRFGPNPAAASDP